MRTQDVNPGPFQFVSSKPVVGPAGLVSLELSLYAPGKRAGRRWAPVCQRCFGFGDYVNARQQDGWRVVSVRAARPGVLKCCMCGGNGDRGPDDAR